MDYSQVSIFYGYFLRDMLFEIQFTRVKSGIIDPLSEKPGRVDNKQQYSVSTPYHKYEYFRWSKLSSQIQCK